MLFAIGFILAFLGFVGTRMFSPDVGSVRHLQRSMGINTNLTRNEAICAAVVMLGIVLMVASIAILAWRHLP
jgi:amino acid transporter